MHIGLEDLGHLSRVDQSVGFRLLSLESSSPEGWLTEFTAFIRLWFEYLLLRGHSLIH